MSATKPCPNCEGQGYVDDEDGNHDCPMCDGEGYVPADFDPRAAGWWPVAEHVTATEER